MDCGVSFVCAVSHEGRSVENAMRLHVQVVGFSLHKLSDPRSGDAQHRGRYEVISPSQSRRLLSCFRTCFNFTSLVVSWILCSRENGSTYAMDTQAMQEASYHTWLYLADSEEIWRHIKIMFMNEQEAGCGREQHPFLPNASRSQQAVDRKPQIWLRSVLGPIPPPCLLRRIRNGIQCEATYVRAIAFHSTIPKSTMRIPFASEKHANIAKQVIDVDRELQPEVVKRTLTVEGNSLVAYVARCMCGRINV